MVVGNGLCAVAVDFGPRWAKIHNDPDSPDTVKKRNRFLWNGTQAVPYGNKNTPKAKLSGCDCALVSHVGQQSDLTGALDGGGQSALVSGTGTGGTAGQDLATLGQVTAQLSSVLVVNSGHLIHRYQARTSDRPAALRC